MPSSITSVLNYPYTSLWLVDSTLYSVSGNVFTVTTPHPFITGDKAYLSLHGLPRRWAIYYIINITTTTFRLATSLANATNGIAITPPSPLTSISNAPTVYQSLSPASIVDMTEPFLSYSKSSQTFSVTDNVAIDFTVPRWGFPPVSGGAGNALSSVAIPWAVGLISDIGEYKLGFLDTIFFIYGDSVTGAGFDSAYRLDLGIGNRSTLTFNCRILLQNLRASIRVKTTTGSYITLFTSSVLSNNIQGLRFFSSLSINNLALTNCTITYL